MTKAQQLQRLRAAAESLNKVSREVQKLRQECIAKGIKLPILNRAYTLRVGYILGTGVCHE